MNKKLMQANGELSRINVAAAAASGSTSTRVIIIHCVKRTRDMIGPMRSSNSKRTEEIIIISLITGGEILGGNKELSVSDTIDNCLPNFTHSLSLSNSYLLKTRVVLTTK